MSTFLDEWDLLLTPALPIPAFVAGRNTPDDPADPGWPGWTPFTYPFNLSQQPAAVVPCRLKVPPVCSIVTVPVTWTSR